MHDKIEKEDISSRAFVALIRARLDAMGRSDVRVSRQWIDDRTPGEPFIMRVPVGPALVVPLRRLPASVEQLGGAGVDGQAEDFASALINLHSAEGMVLEYVEKIRHSAWDAITAARRDGFDVTFVNVGIKLTYARHLTGEDWKEAAYHLLGEVQVRHTSFYLRPEVSALSVEEPGDVADALSEILAEESERQLQLAELDAVGADLTVDAITLDLLQAHGLDAVEALRDVWRQQCVNIPVEHLGREAHLSLISSQGKVTASMDLGDAVWNGEHLWFVGEEQGRDHKHFVGRTLGDLVRHPAFTSRPVSGLQAGPADLICFDLSDKLLFDAETGNLWKEERIAA